MLNNHSGRAHALLSASSAHRWLACPPSAVAAEAYPEQDTDFTREGTLAHEVAESVAGGKFLDISRDITQEMVDCAREYRDYIAEQIRGPYATVLLEQRVDFSTWVPDGFGTCDCVILQDNTLTIIDYKYGKGVAVGAEGNPQMRLYALGALNEFGFAYDVTKVEMHIFQPRLNNVSMDSMTADELLAWGEKEVKPTAAKAAKGKGNYSPGEHCRFCPHAGRCRALTKVCTEYVETHGMRVAVPVMASWEVAEVLKMEPLVTLWLKRVKDQALTAMLSGDQVPGFKVVAGRGSRTWADELQVAETLKAAGYGQEDITKTELLSVAAMEKAIGKKKASELLDGLIEKRTGSPTIAPENDKRPVYDPVAEAKKDFMEN